MDDLLTLLWIALPEDTSGDFEGWMVPSEKLPNPFNFLTVRRFLGDLLGKARQTDEVSL